MSASQKSDAGFRIRPVVNGTAVRIDLLDEALTFDVVESLKARLKAAVVDVLDEGHRSFVLDLATVETVDSSGVGVLIAVHHQVTAVGGSLAVSGACPFVLKVLKMMQLDRFLDLHPDVEHAVKAVVDTF